jgi:hypothetical protein
VDGRFLRAFTDPAAKLKILGCSVYPFCLKYRVRLLAIESPFVTEGKPITPLDLIVAVKICAEKPINDLGFWDKVQLHRLGRRPIILNLEVQRFVDYVHSTAWPKFWTANSKSGATAEDAGIPWPLMVVASLVKHGFEEKRVWEMPECQAIWFNAAHSSMNGSEMKVLTTEEEAFMDEQERLEKVAPSAEVKTPADHVPKT